MFAHGTSGNPKGRPKKGQSIAGILRKIGNELVDCEINGKVKKVTKTEKVMRAVYTEAEDGQPWAVNFIADRTEGKPVPIQPTITDPDSMANLFTVMSELMGTTHGEDPNT